MDEKSIIIIELIIFIYTRDFSLCMEQEMGYSGLLYIGYKVAHKYLWK
jgi:hypothetical protein